VAGLVVLTCCRMRTVSSLQEAEKPLADTVAEEIQVTVQLRVQGAIEEQKGNQGSPSDSHTA
jgi:hypothetical protein